MLAVRPDSLELGGVGVKSAKPAAGDRTAVQETDEFAPPDGGMLVGLFRSQDRTIGGVLP